MRRPPTSTLFPYTTLFRSYEAFVPVTQAAPAFLTIFLRTSTNAEALGNTMRNAIAGIEVRRKIVRNARSEEHTSELQSQSNLVCRLVLEKKKQAGRATLRG